MRPAVPDPPEIQAQLWTGFTPGYAGWDIGANCGQTLAHMTRLFQYVVAFEPAAECQPYLAPWTVSHGVEVLPIAISDHDGEISLAALPDKIDTGQLVTRIKGMEWDPDQPGTVDRTVASRTVDSLVDDCNMPRPDFCKIDVEGHEDKVLRGAQNIIERYRPQMLIEFHTRALHDFCRDNLAEHGYDVHLVRHPHYYPGTDLWWSHGWLKAFQG